jgi:hypothetical protein
MLPEYYFHTELSEYHKDFHIFFCGYLPAGRCMDFYCLSKNWHNYGNAYFKITKGRNIKINGLFS